MSHSVTDSTVLLGHGSGGQMMKRIIDEVFLDAFGSPELLEGNDAGVAALPASGRIAMSTDSFVVSPQFFPGGNIGRLAVCGTVNDVATSGANVRYLSCGFILEEGYPMDKLHQIVQTMAETAHEAGVSIITGDTKVVERGGADGVSSIPPAWARFPRAWRSAAPTAAPAMSSWSRVRWATTASPS